MSRIAAFLLALSLSIPGSAFAASFDSLVSFGDSLSDTGSGPATPPSYGGRFSNGPVWEEYLASSLGIAPADTADYAIGGATSGLTGLGGTPTGLLTQVASYSSAPVSLGTSTLFTVWAGGNDAIQSAISGTDPIAGASQAAANIASAVTQLAATGAQYFLVPNLPNGGLFPITAQLGANPDAANQLTIFFDSQLDADLAPLASSLGITIFRLDTYSLFQSIVADPAAYGLTDVTTPCTSGSTVCANPDQHLFWDNVHPTTTVHGFIGAAALAVVPEPEVAALLAAAALALAMALRARVAQVSMR